MPRKKVADAAVKSQANKKTKWPFPRATLEKALHIPYALKDNNGGNPWETEEVRKAVGTVGGGNAWFYLTAASRDYGLTTGTRDTPKISLEELGREIVYAPNPEVELALKKQAFQKIDIFKRVLDYYKGSNLPDMKYLGNTLTKEFGLDPETHEEFAKTFRENCQYLGIESGVPTIIYRPRYGNAFRGCPQFGSDGFRHPTVRRTGCEAPQRIFFRGSSQHHYARRQRLQSKDRQPPGQRCDSVHHHQ